jgi:phage baseplate assembly protein W
MPYKNFEISNASTQVQTPVKESQFYKGFSSVGDITMGTRLYDFALIKQNLINHFNTRQGERVMNPEFGCIIWDLLMEPMTDSVKKALANNIKTICTSDSRVYPTDITINEYEGGYLIELTLMLMRTDETATLKMKFDQKLGFSAQ